MGQYNAETRTVNTPFYQCCQVVFSTLPFFFRFLIVVFALTAHYKMNNDDDDEKMFSRPI